MTTNKKTFDSVQMMRSIRDALSEQIKGMTIKEERAYISNHLREENTDGIAVTDTKGNHAR